MRITVDFEITPRAQRALLWLATPLAALAGSALVARAAWPTATTTWIQTGQRLDAAKLKLLFDETDARLTALEGADPACPRGYTRDATESAFVRCQRASDAVVKVGTGASAFWIDQFEASVWSLAGGSGTQYGTSGDDYPATFPRNGQLTAPLYAVSKSGVKPSVGLTWFQAMEACAASGKELPDAQQWLRAARGTTDGAGCNIGTLATRVTGGGATCRSSSGAEDMIGNVWEWTSEWVVGAGSQAQGTWANTGGNGGNFGGDGTWNVTAQAFADLAWRPATPAAALRGGSFIDGTRAGVFALNVGSTPAEVGLSTGFRCVLTR